MGDQSLIKTSFASGELSPLVWGRTDLAKFHAGCSVMRNAFVNYRGGSSSRAGLAWVGCCKQDGSAYPPRNIPFRFSATQSYVLEFGDKYMRVVSNGAYVTETPAAISAVSLTYPPKITVPGTAWVAGDWVYLADLGGSIEMNSRTFIISDAAGDVYTLHNIFDLPVNALDYTAYTFGGTAARIYTNTDAPYAAVDLPFLKYTQSADVMTLTCVNQDTGAEYPPYDLQRSGVTSWAFVETTYDTSIKPPTGVTGATTTVGTWHYQYVITAVDANTGDESVASAIINVASVNIATTAGTITLGWNPVENAGSYNIYRAPISVAAQVPLGGIFGYVGTSFGTQFADSNTTPSLTKTPPVHLNPFARGAVLEVFPTAGGSGYTQSTTTASVVSATGTGAVLTPVVVSGAVVAYIVEDGGKGYKDGDTVSVVDSGGAPGVGAVAKLTVGAQTGTYPGVPAYFQQRRIYGYTTNKPDTYFGSKVGSYTNMDQTSIPLENDAIVGTPWGQQVNGIQWLIPMPGGLIIGTGDDVWQLSGQGGGALSPSSEQATPQETYGFSKTVPPLKIGYNLVYVQPYGSAVRELQYNFYANIYAGNDIAFLSNHLLDNHQIVQWAWSREPNKIVWVVRDDGKFLSLTYLKEQEINGWARHDTCGLVQSVCSIPEPPVDATYFVIRRYITGVGKWVYYQERMDNRLWQTNEDCWCIDAGSALAQETRDAVLTMSSASGTRSLSAGFVIAGGTGYTAPSVVVVDPTGKGSGAAVSVTHTAGVIDGVVINSPGKNYGAYNLSIKDPTGSGAAIGLVIDTSVVVSASNPVFSAADVGAIIRVGGGRATVTAYQTPTLLSANLTQAVVVTVPNDPNAMPVPSMPGKWSIAHPIGKLTNLEHLEGMTVSILADGSVQPQQVVKNGSITLQYPASDIKVGLPFTAQIQTLHADAGPGQKTIQDKRKHISSATVRVVRSRGFGLGANQPIASTMAMEPDLPWTNLQYPKDRGPTTDPGVAIPLYTGDFYLNIDDDWNNKQQQASEGMFAVQQTNPLPLNLLMTVISLNVGDTGS